MPRFFKAKSPFTNASNSFAVIISFDAFNGLVWTLQDTSDGLTVGTWEIGIITTTDTYTGSGTPTQISTSGSIGKPAFMFPSRILVPPAYKFFSLPGGNGMMGLFFDSLDEAVKLL